MRTNIQIDLSMTQVEQMMKYCLSLRPDIQNRIITPDEFNEYLLWLIDNFHNNPDFQYQLQDIVPFFSNSRTRDLIKQVKASPSDPSTLSSLSSGLVNHKEENYMLANQDISAGRMLRYFPSQWHTADYFEIYYALSGECPIYFQDEVITVKPGTVLIVAPSVLRASPCYADDQVLLFFMVRSSTFDHVFWNQLSSDNLMSVFFRQALSGQQPTSYLHFETGGDPEFKDLLLRIYGEHTQPGRYSDQVRNAMMSMFFILLLRHYEGTARLPRTKDFFWKHEFSAILTYIQTNYAIATQEAVAQHFHYSERQIGRIVQNCTGFTFAQLVLKLRMEQAVKLLRQNAAPIDTIAELVGYSTPSSFFRAFSKYYGCTPRAYIAKLSAYPNRT